VTFPGFLPKNAHDSQHKSGPHSIAQLNTRSTSAHELIIFPLHWLLSRHYHCISKLHFMWILCTIYCVRNESGSPPPVDLLTSHSINPQPIYCLSGRIIALGSQSLSAHRHLAVTAGLTMLAHSPLARLLPRTRLSNLHLEHPP